MPIPDDFFLDPDDSGDDYRFLAPKRMGVTVEPLIDGMATFRAIEKAIAGATKSVYLAAWIFNSSMKLAAQQEVNKILATRGVKNRAINWAELLAIVAGLGAEVHVLLADFDPILVNDLHHRNWSSYRELLVEAKKHASGRMLIMCSLHDAEISVLAERIQRQRLDRIVNTLNSYGVGKAQKRFRDMPGLWRFVTFNEATKKFNVISTQPWLVRPASHHQKICVIDGVVGFCGGLDVQTGRLDTTQHKKLWHDTHCRVDAQLAVDLARNFIGRWNHERTAFNEFISAVNTPTRRLIADPVPTLAVSSSSPPSSGSAVGQLIRTLSENASLDPVPNNIRADIKSVYQRAINLAQSYIYIENQYFRDRQLVDWLIERASDVPSMMVILVLPIAPEEVAGPGRADEVTLHGLYLQHDALTRLQAELGSRLGLYSMVAPQTATKRRATDWVGSRQVYVHSKTMIIDDFWATIGSANTNSRSFEMDTEANIHWYDSKSVKKLRLDLWRELLDSPPDLETWSPPNYISKWSAIANLNRNSKPTARRGFIVPHDPNNSAAQGKESIFIPDAFSELVETDADNDYLA